MASRTPPKMRQHKRGYYFCNWGDEGPGGRGKDHYLGMNKAEAEKRYRKSLAEWLEWRKLRDQVRQQQRQLPRLGLHMTVLDLVEQYLDWKFSDGNVNLWRYYKKHLQRFAWSWGRASLVSIDARHLILLIQRMQKGMRRPDGTTRRYASKTINHDIVAVKGMLEWAMGLRLMPMISLKVVKTLPLGPPPDMSLPIEQVRSIILRKLDPAREQSWAAINYLTAMRPIEVVRFVHQQGRWLDRGIWEMDRGKMDFRTRQKRVVVFSDEALEWAANCQRIWKTLGSYSHAMRKVCGRGMGPSRFRHSAAKHLHWSGLDLADVQLLLGHLPRGVILSYTPIRFQPLRAKVSRLTLRASPGIVVPESASSA